MSEQLNSPITPIEWPKVTIDGVTIEVKYSMGLNYRAAKVGLDLREMSDPVKLFAIGLDLFALIAAPQLQKMGQPVLSGEEWSERLQGFDDYKKISEAVGRAYELSKVAPLETGPAPNPPASTDPRPN